MTRANRGLSTWLELILAGWFGFLVVAFSWSTATSSGARFFVGVLLGLSIALTAAGVIALVNEGGHGRDRARHP